MSTQPRHFDKRPRRQGEWPEVELVDVTLRDGGFLVGFNWPPELAHALAAGASASGADYVELGYVGGLPAEHDSPYGKTADLDARAINSVARGLDAKLAVMVHPSGPRRGFSMDGLVEAGVSLVRVVYHPDWSDRIQSIAESVKTAGAVLAVNLALCSRYDVESLVAHARDIVEACEPDVFYIADTCSALLPRQVEEIFDSLRGLSVRLGFHPHDFLSMGLANALAACRAGASLIDTSIAGLGRGGGNLRTELWMSLAIDHGLRGYSVTPLIACIDAIRRADIAVDMSMLSMFSGVMNLTPPEQQRLASFARTQRIDVELLAAGMLNHPGTSVDDTILALVAHGRRKK